LAGNAPVHYLSKSPAFSAKIATLWETFPDARIIYLVRTPLEVIPSYFSLLWYTWQLLGDPIDRTQCRDFVLDTVGHWYRYPLECLDRSPNDRYLVVRYDELTRDPEQTVRAIYSHFGIAIGARYAQVLAREAEKVLAYESEHEYTLAQAGVTREQIVEEFRDVFARFGFDTGAPV
jgi:hypothetical protein